MSADAPALRIGEVARRVGTTPRTIRYYEEIGLLPGGTERTSGQHRVYGEQDVERLQEALRLKQLLGISLEELRDLVEAEDARRALRDEWHHGDPGAGRRREILREALGHVERQLALLGARRAEIERLEAELAERREGLVGRLADHGDPSA
jgi:DNA-binding transcriptional MerR regulator